MCQPFRCEGNIQHITIIVRKNCRLAPVQWSVAYSLHPNFLFTFHIIYFQKGLLCAHIINQFILFSFNLKLFISDIGEYIETAFTFMNHGRYITESLEVKIYFLAGRYDYKIYNIKPGEWTFALCGYMRLQGRQQTYKLLNFIYQTRNPWN